MSAYARLSSILTNILELLVRRLAPQQDYVIGALRAVEGAEAASIAAALNGDGFWGGSGSIDDLIISVPIRQRATDSDDNVRLRVLLGDLLEEMVSLHIAGARAMSRHSTLREP
jgi:hypothetical protein